MTVWIDVGAHLGERTFSAVAERECLIVYAFEPNLTIAARSFGRHPRFVMLPMAVSAVDGCIDFHIAVKDDCSTTMALDSRGWEDWKGRQGLAIARTVQVASIRLDTFMRYVRIERVEFLKVDAQGADLSVLQSLGERIADVGRIMVEVQVVRSPYDGAATKAEMIAYLQERGFELVNATRQSSDQEENLEFVRRHG